MEHVRSFTDFPALAELQAFLAAKDDVPFETSELYSSAKDAKLVDLEKRKSIFRLFQDSELFDLVNQTVQWLNESDTSYSYQLHRDDITETRYEKGGFFLKHKDYLSVTSNLVEEFTLILCVTPSEKIDGKVVGGETLLFPYASKNGTAFDTTTPGHGLLFRKDLEHSGSVLQNGGEKHILTANLWATRKQTSDQVLFVTFPSNEAHENVKADDEALLKQATNQDTSFALPVDCLKGTMLETHVNFVNRSFEQNDEAVPAVVNYQCTNFTFEEFATVAKILQRAYVNEEAIGNHASCLDFFGPFEAENLLVNLALEKTTLGPDPPSCDRFTKSAEGEQKLPARKKNKTNGSDTNETKYDLDVIVCENESRTEVVNTVARQLGYDSYVPFKMVFVEGIIQHLPDCSSESISVTPVALLLGDYNHVFAIQKVGGTHTDAIDASTLRDFHVKKNYWAKEPDWTKKRDEIFDSLEWDISQKAMDAYTEGRGFSLKFALGDDENVRSSITSFVFDGILMAEKASNVSSPFHTTQAPTQSSQPTKKVKRIPVQKMKRLKLVLSRLLSLLSPKITPRRTRLQRAQRVSFIATSLEKPPLLGKKRLLLVTLSLLWTSRNASRPAFRRNAL